MKNMKKKKEKIKYIPKTYKTTTQNSIKAFECFLHILLQLCGSRFCLIILEEKFWCKSQGELKRNYLEHNEAYKRNMDECRSLYLKAENIIDYWKLNKF